MRRAIAHYQNKTAIAPLPKRDRPYQNKTAIALALLIKMTKNNVWDGEDVKVREINLTT